MFKRSYKYVGKKIQKLIPEVKKRNKEALMYSGGESTLLYIPTGFKDDAVYDDIRNTYRNEDVKYELYLNNYFDGCERLYGNDTDTYPSIRMAFPSNPEGQSHREDGFQLMNRNSAWTLWYPILPTKGVIVVRQTPFLDPFTNNQGKEMYLLENVTHSYFPINNGSGLHLLHQETPVTRIEDGSPVKLTDLPTVEDTLAIYKNDMQYDLTGLSVSGSYNVSDQGTKLESGSSIISDDLFLNNKLNIDIKPLTSGGQIVVSWGLWSDNTTPNIVIDRDLNKVSVNMFGSSLVKQTNFIVNTNQTYNLRVELNNNIFKVWLGSSKVIEVKLSLDTNFNTLQPLTESSITLESVDVELLLNKMYIMNLI